MQHFIQGGWLTAEQIKALKAKLNKEDGTTALDDQMSKGASSHKVLRDGQLLIERNGQTYTLTGQQR